MLFFFFRAPIAPTRSLHRKPLTFACHCALLHVNRNPQRKCGRPSPNQARQHAHNTQIVFSIISTIYNTYRVLYFALYRFLPTKTHLTVAITRQNKKSVHDLCLLTLTPETEANRRKRRAEKFCTTQREDFSSVRTGVAVDKKKSAPNSRTPQTPLKRENPTMPCDAIL